MNTPASGEGANGAARVVGRRVMQTLVLFDIDGTLTQSNLVDNRCYVWALSEVLDGAKIDTDWTRYPHVTDEGILVTLFERVRGRSPSAEESRRARSLFVGLLGQELAGNPLLCRRVPGAVEMLGHLTSTPGYVVGLATGAWAESAALKLGCAGLSGFAVPLASSSDAISRAAILSIAIERARSQFGVASFGSIVCVGDAIWDAWAARSLGLPFVGIGEGERGACLLAEGAKYVIPDYANKRSFLELLSACSTAA